MTAPTSNLETLHWWFVHTDIDTEKRFVIGWPALPGENYGYLIRTAEITYIDSVAKQLRTLFVDYQLRHELESPRDWLFYSSVFGYELKQHTTEVMFSVPIGWSIH